MREEIRQRFADEPAFVALLEEYDQHAAEQRQLLLATFENSPEQ